MNWDESWASPAPVEPSSELRTAAATLRQWYLAMRDVGFTESEALRIIGDQLKGQS